MTESGPDESAMGSPAAPFIPTTFEDLSPAFLSQCLAAAGVLSTGRVRARRIEIIGEGIGFAGQVARVHLDYEDGAPDSPETLIAKLPSVVPRNRTSMALLNGYEREVCFFRELADRSRLRTPRCYYAEMDVDPLYERRPAIQRCIDRLPVGAMRMLLPLGRLAARASKRRYLVLMQDLAPARCGDQVEGCDLARAQQMSRCLAAFHASYWCDTSLIEKIWLPGIDLSPRGLQAIHRRSRRGFLRAHRDELPAQTIEACRFLDRHVEAVMQHLAGPPWTVLHGDYRLDNLLFNESTTWVTDFQGVCRGRPGYDLGYFICGSIDAGVDVRHVIDAYCEALRGHGIHDYTEADCRRDCTLSTLLQVYLYVATDDLIDMGTARGLRLIEVMRDRLFSRLPEPPYDTLL